MKWKSGEDKKGRLIIMLGLLFLGMIGVSGIKAAYDNYEMKNYTRKVDKDGNVHYMDRLCNDLLWSSFFVTLCSINTYL